MYIIDFDIVAIVLSFITLYLYYTGKKVANSRSLRYATVAWAVLGSSLFSTASSIAINALPRTPSAAIIALTTVFYVFHAAIPLLVTRYVMTVAACYPSSKAKRILIFLPWIASLLIILSNPLTGFAFFVDSDGAYRHGSGLTVLYSIASIYLALVLWAILFRIKNRSRLHRLTIGAALALPLAAIFLQSRIPGLMLECFAASTSVLFVLLTIQNINELIDGQTGLYNREGFLQFLQQAFDRHESFTVLILHSAELANLQGVVDAHVHGEITNTVSDWFSRAAGKQSLSFYLDTGLFAILRERSDPDDPIGQLALKIIERSAEAWSLGLAQIELPVRIAVLQCPKDATFVPDVLDYVDQLTELPVQVSQRHIFYASDFTPEKRRREAAIASALGKAIEDGRPELRYQPIYSIKEKRAVALDVLLGFNLASGEPIYQSEILRIAERMGIVRQLSALVLDRAFEWYARGALREKGIERLQIRLVSALCVEKDWPLSIARIAEARGMELSRLCLEITETTVTNAGKNLKTNMGLLAERGVSFALDDYGSGYTELGQVISMPFSLVKLDKRIVHAGFRDGKGRQLLEGSITLFKHLGRAVVAEGVENAEQAEVLSVMDCDYLQGHYFGRPMDGDKALVSLR
jgi:EAL domain-containing protein (putative c-di-GMP-specific phosphodiesterase class I)/GGDEF domain-containing protein